MTERPRSAVSSDSIELLGQDNLGRKSYRVGKYVYTMEIKNRFDDWIEKKKGIRLGEFCMLKPSEKEKIFLLWKWGLSDHANAELESSRRGIMAMVKERVGDWYLDNMRRFEGYCYEVKQDIGLADRVRT